MAYTLAAWMNEMFKNLLLPYVNQASFAAPSAVARQLCDYAQAHLAITVTLDLPVPVPHDWVGIPVDMSTRMREQAIATAEQIRARLVQEFAGKAEVRLVESLALRPSATAAMTARYADLCVLSGLLSEGDNGALHEYFEDVLISSGAPVLMVPVANVEVLPAKHIVIAWRPSREAKRAVQDALPLLRAAKTIDVLIVDPEIGEAAHGPEPGANIAAFLARHGLSVQVVTKPRMGQSTAKVIMNHCVDSAAGMVVAGGYGHSRLREFLLGGVTLELLRCARGPVFFSH